MNRASEIVAAVLLLVTVLSSASTAQQAETAKQPRPKLTSDGVQTPRGQNGAAQRGTESRDAASAPNAGGQGTEEWASYSLGEIGVSIELPGEPQVVNVPPTRDLPEDSILKSLVYKSNDLVVFANYGLTPNSEGAWDFVATIMDEFMKQQGVTKAKLRTDRKTKAKRVPLKITGKVNGVETEFRGTIFFIDEQQEVLMVLTEFAQSNASARATATRALDSVQISR